MFSLYTELTAVRERRNLEEKINHLSPIPHLPRDYGSTKSHKMEQRKEEAKVSPLSAREVPACSVTGSYHKSPSPPPPPQISDRKEQFPQ